MNRIADSLIKEAKIPAELAQRVAKEAEKQLLKSRTKYLTAPLVREVVNAVLVEKGLEEYRHKLTRLGLPVHEVSTVINVKSKSLEGSVSVYEAAGEAVLKEYTLLTVFPRDISDAHLSGLLHIDHLESSVLRPSEVIHDLRFFFQNGFVVERVSPTKLVCSPPQDLQSALSMVFDVFLHSRRESTGMQMFEYFNVFLAPFVKGMEPSILRRSLSLFALGVCQHGNASFCLEFIMPEFIGDKPAVGSGGKVVGKYRDFAEESQLIASTFLDMLSEASANGPLYSPEVIVKARAETLADEKAQALFLKSHALSSQKGSVYYANLTEKGQAQTVFSSSGCKIKTDLSKDWEIDTLRTGCLGHVTVNLPRIAYDSDKDKAKFLEVLKERLELAARTLEIKYKALRQHGRGLLPFLTQSFNGDSYYRLENSVRLINLIGLKEASEAFCQKKINEDETRKFAVEIADSISEFIPRLERRHGKRLLPAILPDFEAAKRLVRLDIERYGIAKVHFSGAREEPFYSNIRKLNWQNLSQTSQVESGLRELDAGGSLTVIELGTAEQKPGELVSMTQRLTKDFRENLFTYERRLTYCVTCKKSSFGRLPKCPSCGSTASIVTYDRFPLA